VTHQLGMERVGGAVNAGARAIPIGAPATGRRPRVAGIGLESAGVQASGRGIPVDARLRSALLSDTIPAISDVLRNLYCRTGSSAWPDHDSTPPGQGGEPGLRGTS
jgi:hypothetical protein